MRYSAFVMLLAMLLLPVQVFAEQVRGRVVGVHDDDTLLPNGSGQAAPTRRKPTEDEIVVQLNPLLGTSYSNYNDFYKNQLKGGHFLGLAIGDNIHPELQTHLTQAEKVLRDKGLSDKASDWGIYKIGGGGPESGGHRWSWLLILTTIAIPMCCMKLVRWIWIGNFGRSMTVLPGLF
jgi:hypothetical protein